MLGFWRAESFGKLMMLMSLALEPSIAPGTVNKGPSDPSDTMS